MSSQSLFVLLCISHNIPIPVYGFQASSGGVRRFTKPPESLERLLELSRHRGRKRTQKRPNYKNLGEEDDDGGARGGTGGGGGGSSSSREGADEGWDDNGRGGEGGREREKGKGTEILGTGGSSKGSRASGETAEGECECRIVCVCSTSLVCHGVPLKGKKLS